MTDSVTFQYYRLRTNVADSRNIGVEGYAEADLLQLQTKFTKKRPKLVVFGNVALIDARYVDRKSVV